MKFTDITLPGELEEIRTFWAEIFSSHQTYPLMIELDEEELIVLDYSCTCKGFVINRDGRGIKAMCKHLKQFEIILKSMGYLND